MNFLYYNIHIVICNRTHHFQTGGGGKKDEGILLCHRIDMRSNEEFIFVNSELHGKMMRSLLLKYSRSKLVGVNSLIVDLNLYSYPLINV